MTESLRALEEAVKALRLCESQLADGSEPCALGAARNAIASATAFLVRSDLADRLASPGAGAVERWRPIREEWCERVPDGGFVLYTDHTAALAARDAEIAGLRQRVEAAEADARLERAIQRAAEVLPAGYAVSVTVEYGAGWAHAETSAGRMMPFDGQDMSLAEAVESATNTAIAHAAQQAEPTAGENGG